MIGINNRKFNDYTVDGDVTYIHVLNRKKEKFDILIDTEDLQKLIDLDCYWHVAFNPKIKGYYAQASVYMGIVNKKPKYKTMYLHRVILDASENDGKYVHHKNHTKTLDNRKENLAATNNENNSKDRKGKNENNKSGYRNVCWLKNEKKWVVQLQIKGVNTRLSFFDDVHEAGRYAEEMRKKYYGEFAGKN